MPSQMQVLSSHEVVRTHSRNSQPICKERTDSPGSRHRYHSKSADESGGDPSFRQLLEELLRAHNSEVSYLKKQIDQLSGGQHGKPGEQVRSSTTSQLTVPPGRYMNGNGHAKLTSEKYNLSESHGEGSIPLGPNGFSMTNGVPDHSDGESVYTYMDGNDEDNQGIAYTLPGYPARQSSRTSRRSVSSNGSQLNASEGSRQSRGYGEKSSMPRQLLKVFGPIERWALLTDRLLTDPREAVGQDTEITWELLPIWFRDLQKAPAVPGSSESKTLRRMNSRRPTLSRGDSEATSGGAFNGNMAYGSGCMADLVILPNRAKHFTWVIIGAIMILFDAVTIPVTIFQDEDYEAFLSVSSKITAVYWGLDIIFNCFIGLNHPDGYIELRPAKIRKHYFKTSFARDLTIVLIDAALMVFTQVIEGDATDLTITISQDMRPVNVSKLLGWIRLVRLLRVGRVRTVMGMALFRLSSDWLLLYTVTELIVFLLVLNHYVACMWYGVGMIFGEWSDNPRNWVSVYSEEDTSIRNTYFMAYHWSLTQFSPATNNIAPQNRHERLFAAMVVAFALIAFSAFLGSLNSTLNQVRLASGKAAKEESLIRTYIDMHNVSAALSTRIRQFFKLNFSHGRGQLHEEDIEFFKQLPYAMKASLRYEVFIPALRISMIRYFEEDDSNMYADLCHKAMAEKTYFPGQDIFLCDEPAEWCCCVTAGRLSYEDYEERKTPVVPGDQSWLAELIMFTPWIHRGQLSADVTSELVKLDAGAFFQILNKGTLAFEKLRKYAIFVVGYCEGKAEEEGEEQTDLPITIENQEDLQSRVEQLTELQRNSTAIAGMKETGEASQKTDASSKAKTGGMAGLLGMARGGGRNSVKMQ